MGFAPSTPIKPSATNYLQYAFAAQALSGAFSSFMQGKAQRNVSRANAQIAETFAGVNERLADLKAADALKRGQEQEHALRRGIKKLVGQQRAIEGAQNIRTDAGSALDIQQETLEYGEFDAATIRINALREAFGYKMEGIGAKTSGGLTAGAYRMQGRQAMTTSKLQAFDTLLTGGLQAYKAWKGGK